MGGMRTIYVPIYLSIYHAHGVRASFLPKICLSVCLILSVWYRGVHSRCRPVLRARAATYRACAGGQTSAPVDAVLCAMHSPFSSDLFSPCHGASPVYFLLFGKMVGRPPASAALAVPMGVGVWFCLALTASHLCAPSVAAEADLRDQGLPADGAEEGRQMCAAALQLHRG